MFSEWLRAMRQTSASQVTRLEAVFCADEVRCSKARRSVSASASVGDAEVETERADSFGGRVNWPGADEAGYWLRLGVLRERSVRKKPQIMMAKGSKSIDIGHSCEQGAPTDGTPSCAG